MSIKAKTSERIERCMQNAYDNLGISDLHQLVAKRYVPTYFALHFAEDLERLTRLGHSAARMRPLLEAAIERRQETSTRLPFLTKKDLHDVEKQLEGLPPSRGPSPSPSTSIASSISVSLSLSRPPPSAPSEASSSPLPSLPPSPTPPAPENGVPSRAAAAQTPAGPRPSLPIRVPDTQPVPQFVSSQTTAASRKRRRTSTIRTPADLEAPPPPPDRYLDQNLRDELQQSLDHTVQVLGKCMRQLSDAAEACQKKNEEASRDAAAALKVLEEAKKASPQPMSGIVVGALEQAEQDLAAALKQEEAASRKLLRVLDVVGDDEPDDHDKAYLNKLRTAYEAATRVVQSAREKIEDAQRAKTDAEGQVSRLQAVADEKAAIEEQSRTALGEAEQLEALYRGFRIVVRLGPAAADRVLADSFKDHLALIDYAED